VKLLRVLQEREFERLGATKPTKVDVRLVTATNRDLHRSVDEGTFRLDLLYRLQVVEIALPPLRDREEDLLPLARHFLQLANAEHGRDLKEIAADAERLLMAHSWPGNVRELENAMARAAVLAERGETVLRAEHLPPALQRAA
jgi:transcriptional regulator with PAS, ATPase and Fis domain